MIRISQLKLKVGHTREELFEEIVRQAHGKKPLSWQIVRKMPERSHSFFMYIR